MARFSLLLCAATVVFFTKAQRAQGQSLDDALNQYGLTEYANFNAQNPSGIEGSGQRTIFAPDNSAMEGLYQDPAYQSASRAKRQLINGGQIAINQQFTELQPPLGQTFYEFIPDEGLVVTSGNSTSALANNKVADPGSRPRFRARSEGGLEARTPEYAARYYSGSGRATLVLKEGIKFDGGIIHIVDSVFKFAVDIREGIKESGLGFYEAIFNRVPGYWSVVVNNPKITVILPSKEAIYSCGKNITDAEWAKILDYGTITTGLVGYTPSLKHNTTYRSRGGYFAVTWKEGQLYINDAKVVARNNILSNGVIQVLDKVLFPPDIKSDYVPGPHGTVLKLNKTAADAFAGGWPYVQYPINTNPNGTHPGNGTIPPPASGAESLLIGSKASGMVAGLAIVAALNLLV